jgi:hypothetical protein
LSLESSLYTALTGNVALAGLVSTRIKPDVLPQGTTLPAIAYQRISTPRAQVFGATQAVAVSRPRIQFSCWGNTFDEALAVCAALRTALLATSWAVTFEGEYTLRDPESNYYRRNLDAVIAHVGE